MDFQESRAGCRDSIRNNVEDAQPSIAKTVRAARDESYSKRFNPRQNLETPVASATTNQTVHTSPFGLHSGRNKRASSHPQDR